MKLNYSPDDNTGGTSSSSPAAESEVSHQDVAADSSSAEASQSGQAAQPSFEDAMKSRLAETEKPAVSTEKDEAGEAQQLNETAEAKAKADLEAKEKTGDKEDVTGEEEQTEDKGPIPYERFQEVVQKRNEVQQEFDRVAPLAKAQETLLQFCQTNALSNQDFVQAMEFAALLKNNPTQFMEKFKPILEGLGVLAGDKLPEDLQKDVEDNVMPLARAKELAQLRAQRSYQGNVQALTAKQKEQQAQAQFTQSISDAWTGWDATKQKSDPDFKPGSKSGMWELVNDRMTSLAQAVGANGQPIHPIRSPQDAIALAELAYKFVKEHFTHIRGGRNGTRKVLSSGSSSQTTKTDPEDESTFEAAMLSKAREKGLIQ